MKKRNFFICSFICFALLICATPGFSSTVYFGVDNTLNFNLLDGFDLFTSGVSNPQIDLSLAVQYQATGGAVPNDIVIPGEDPIKRWDIILTNYGVYGEKLLTTNLAPGIVLSLTSSSTFNLSNIQLLSDDVGNGFYNLPYQIIQSAYQDGTLYTATAVPIPAAVWLLGSGVVGLVALKRRKKA